MQWLSVLLCCGVAAAQTHPLDPLTKEEFASAVAVLKSAGRLAASTRIPALHLNEPPKSEVLAFRPGAPFRREAFAVVFERASNRTSEAVVDLRTRTLVSWKDIPGVQPNFMGDDYGILLDVVKKDPGWQAAISKRGISDFDHVQVDPWAAGNFGFPEEQGVRVMRAVSLYRGTGVNAYAHPIEGVVAYVDVTHRKLIKLVDSGVVPVPKASGEYDAKSVEPRDAPKPLHMVQPEHSFTVQGNEIRWQQWRFRYGVHPREGIVLYQVDYEDGDRVRPILYRGSVSEMAVPYGDPSPAWFFRGVFDEGEYGLGQFMFPLEPKADAPENAVFFDGVLATETGETRALPRAAALYERDGGILWRHTDMDTQKPESRRARDLVVTWIATVGNYDYGFNWIFHQDGTLEMDVVLTGIMQTKAAGEHEPHAHRIGPGLAAVHHQHFFNFRLDLDVDAPGNNSVAEWNTEPMAVSSGNPFGNAFLMKEQVFRTEKEAQRQVNLASNRMWHIFQSGNGGAEHPGYLLVPGDNAMPYASPDSPLRKRAAFLNSHLWVTPYNAEERYAAGPYVSQSKPGKGLPKWTAANRSILSQDVVVWYTLGVTHIPRPEEWPVMTAHHAGFKLIPAGFFERNPGIGVPK